MLVLPLFARRRFPFAAPAAYWLLAAAISFVDGVLLAFIGSLGVVGLASAFLLGNLRNSAEGRCGLIIVLVGIVIVVYNDPGPLPPGDFVFIPLRFAVAWVAGYALRERAEKAEAAEERAAQAEREREAAARVAVAEERARIARELHDIVAHAMSVMVLQVGAVRHKLPQGLEEDREALGRVEQAGRTALGRDAPPARSDAARRRRPGPRAPAGPRQARLVAGGRRPRRASGPTAPRRRAVPASARDRPLRLSNRARGPDQLAQARPRQPRRRDRPLSRPTSSQIEVVDDGAGAATTDGLGHGLVGIRERVKIYGGEMDAGAATGGGFILRARLPLERDRA